MASWPTGIEAVAGFLHTAGRHLDSALLVANTDPDGAYTLLYDAARKSLVAVLQAQGLRATSKGGHYAIQEAITAQFTKPPPRDAFRPFGRLRRSRTRSNTTTYHRSPPMTYTPTRKPSAPCTRRQSKLVDVLPVFVA